MRRSGQVLLWVTLGVICAGNAADLFGDDDTVIVEATRLKRETANKKPLTWAQALGEGNPCLTSKGVLGFCTSFRTCYPYIKVPDVSIWESWVLGNYDTCSYFATNGRQNFGVCCTNQITPLPPDSEKPSTDEQLPEDGGNIKDNIHQNWPPPVPTHPTVFPPTSMSPTSSAFQWPPPVPTHPPDHHYPTHPPASTVSTTPATTPSYPPSTSTSISWPPMIPTHPTRPPTESTTAPILDDGAIAAVCGAKNGALDQERIVGGQNSSPNEWPWVAVLFNNGRQFCGGSLLDNNHILTAAHCVAQMSSWDVARLKVHLGDHNIRTPTEVPHIERKVSRVVRHRGFDFRTLYHDVAILRMDKPVKFTKSVRPICLPNVSTKAYNGVTATVAGWGSLRENGPQPSILQKVSIPIWSNKECSRKYGAAAPGGIIDSMICAGRAAKDSCSGDSGGPLMVKEGNWVQVGIVSWGIGCGKGQYPGVYTRVSSYLPWIRKNLR